MNECSLHLTVQKCKKNTRNLAKNKLNITNNIETTSPTIIRQRRETRFVSTSIYKEDRQNKTSKTEKVYQLRNLLCLNTGSS